MESIGIRGAGKGCSSVTEDTAVSATVAAELLNAEAHRSFDPVSLVCGACAKGPVLAWRMLS